MKELNNEELRNNNNPWCFVIWYLSGGKVKGLLSCTLK